MLLGRFWHRQPTDELAHLRASLAHADRMRDDAVKQYGAALDMLAGRDADVARLQRAVDARETIILARDQRIAELMAGRKEQERDGRGRFRRTAA